MPVALAATLPKEAAVFPAVGGRGRRGGTEPDDPALGCTEARAAASVSAIKLPGLNPSEELEDEEEDVRDMPLPSSSPRRPHKFPNVVAPHFTVATGRQKGEGRGEEEGR